MKYKTFSPELWQLIDRTLDEVLKSNPSPVAAFDADGTLWDTDLGENFRFRQELGLMQESLRLLQPLLVHRQQNEVLTLCGKPLLHDGHNAQSQN